MNYRNSHIGQLVRNRVSPFIKKRFRQNDLSSYELSQRKKTLEIILLVNLIAGIALFLVNVYISAWSIAIALLVMSVLCLPALWLNSRGHYVKSASLTVFNLFFAAEYNLYASGGLQDSGMLAFPIIIIVGSLFFGRRSIPLLSLASIGSLALMAYLEKRGYFFPAPSVTDAGYCLSLTVLLIASSALVWVILRNTERNVAHIRQAEAELLDTYDLTLAGLAKALEFRDSETEGHSRRVVDLSMRLAREMACSAAEIEQIQRGALIHDIGKMAIPDHILSKPGPLDDEEKKTMEKHTVYAREMLAPISFLQPASVISYCHHERWDGRGYPQGLKGDEIPRPARLFAVVDQWDALSSERPYRKAWPREKIIAYIRENSGKRFDPQVVEAFFKIID
ncbi:MAG: HD domain-containing protein [Nitrospirae bacterium]|nr:HD domain-containing protein [Nitrospirota bacterium]